MRLFATVTLVLLLAAGCGSKSGAPSCSQGSAAPPLANAPTGDNVMTVTVNGSLCSSDVTQQYPNEPCTSVTICQPGTSTCQTINNILVDTGSFGLRVFQSLITINLTNETDSSSGKTIAECVGFGDNSSEWGPMATADVKLGNETASNVPIELIDYNYATPPAACSSSQSFPDTSPSEAGFNGILGVGVLKQDCGSNCQSKADNGFYYLCSGSSCTSGTVQTTQQVTNPVSLLSKDNQGVLLELPSLTNECGNLSAQGYLVLGIGSESNNSPSGLTTFTTDGTGDFQTTFDAYQSSSISGFIDSGSSDLFIPPPSDSSLPDCGDTYGSDYAGLYCPEGGDTMLAVNQGNAKGSATASTQFTVFNAYSLVQSQNRVFADIAGTSVAPGNPVYFDWGLPFFYGRTVVVGFQDAKSGDPYYAY